MPPNHSAVRAHRNHWLWSHLMRYYWRLQYTHSCVGECVPELSLSSSRFNKSGGIVRWHRAQWPLTLAIWKENKCLGRYWSAHSQGREQWAWLFLSLKHTSIGGIKLHQFVNFIDSAWEKWPKPKPSAFIWNTFTRMNMSKCDISTKRKPYH